MTDDMELVREYAARQSETAFETLVSRHIGLVHSAAIRQVRDPHLAEEITQAVFTILARKAGSLDSETVLPGWLYRTTRYVSAAAIKMQRRREHRELEAHRQSMIQEADTEPIWEQLSPLLDDAMENCATRTATPSCCAIFKAAACAKWARRSAWMNSRRKNASARALEKLRRIFTKRGVTSTTVIIAGAIAAHSVKAAPVALTKTVTWRRFQTAQPAALHRWCYSKQLSLP